QRGRLLLGHGRCRRERDGQSRGGGDELRVRHAILLASAESDYGAYRRVPAAIVLLAEPLPQPVQVIDTGEMMDLFFKPAYAELQQAMAKAPADRKGWATVYQKAVRLAEMENLLFFRE